jgi:hypothetical protein
MGERSKELLTLSLSKLKECLGKESASIAADLISSGLVLTRESSLLDLTVEGTSRSSVAIDANVDLIGAREEVGRVVNVVGAITVGPGLDLANLHLGREVSLDIIVEASAKIASLVLHRDLGALATSISWVGDLNASVVGIKATSNDLDMEGSILDRLTIDSGGEGVVTGLGDAGVLTRVGAISVITNVNGGALTSSVVHEVSTNLGTTLSELVVKGIAGLDLEFVVAAADLSILKAGTSGD